MKTIKQHFEEIEDPQTRAAALANMWWEDAGNLYPDLASAIYQGFNWSRSPEGFRNWYNFYHSLKIETAA